MACHLHVLLAEKAPVGVILRRGPHKWVSVIKWNTMDDTFERGHWFHGTIYDYLTDISPDGTKLIYVARQRPRPGSYLYLWTAISKPPWLTAIALWPETSTYYAGGSFIDDDTVWIHTEPGEQVKNARDPLPAQLEVVHDWGLRKFRNTWEYRERYFKAKKHQDGNLELECNIHMSMSRPHTCYIRNFASGEKQRINNISWADFDHRGRLVYASEGKLFASQVDGTGHVLPPEELADFTDDLPREMPPPDWAKVW